MNRLLFIIMCLIFQCVNAQQLDYSLLNKENGLSANGVLTICQDQDGFLWAGTIYGLNSYDGNSCTQYFTEDGLNSNFITWVNTDSKGALWVGTNKGVNKFYQNQFISVPVQENSLYSKEILVIKELNNQLYMGAKDGLYQFQDSIFNRISLPETHIYNIWEADDYLWVSTKNGLHLYGDDTLFYPEHKGNVTIVEQDDITWVFTPTQLINWSEKIYFELPFEDGVKDAKYINDKLVFGTYGDGLWAFENNEFRQIDSRGEKFDRTILQLLLTKNNKLWIASNAGITLVKKPVFETILEEYSSGVFPIIEYKKDLFFGGKNGIYNQKNDVISHFPLSDNAKDRFILCMDTNERGELLASGIGGRLYKWKENDFEEVKTTPKNMKANFAYDICANDTATFYAVGLNIYYSKGNDFYDFPTETVGAMYYDILATKKGLWIASSKGLLFWNGHSLKLLNNANGMQDHSLMVLEKDKWGNIWLGSISFGLMRYNHQGFDHYYKQLSDPQIKSLQWDKYRNCMWVGTNDGVNRIDIDSLDEVSYIHTYSTTNGMSLDFCHNKGIELLRDSTLLIAINIAETEEDYIHKYVPENEQANLSPPNVVFTDFKVWGISNFNKERVLSYTDNNITIDFTAIQLNAGKYAEFSWKLNDNPWSEVSKQRSVTFPHLSADKYTLNIKSRLPNQQWSSIEELSFEIISPFWKRGWFILLFCTFIFLFVYQLMNIRIKQKHKKEVERIDLLKQKAALELRAVRSQLNPHFLFNVLNSIQDLLLDNDEEKARIYLSDCAQLMRLVLSYSSQSKIRLEEEIALLKMYLNLEKLRFGDDLKVQWNIEVNTHLTHVPPLILQPYIENAIKHGIKTKGRISISISKQNKQLVCTIEDNGIGRKKAKLSADSKGLKLMQERLDSLNQLEDTKMYQHKITDLAQGTRVELKLKI